MDGLHVAAPCSAGDAAMRALCHDLIQPLAAIRMLADPQVPTSDERLAGIRHEVAWLTDLVCSVLGGEQEDEQEHLDLLDVTRYAVSCGTRSSCLQSGWRGISRCRCWLRASLSSGR